MVKEKNEIIRKIKISHFFTQKSSPGLDFQQPNTKKNFCNKSDFTPSKKQLFITGTFDAFLTTETQIEKCFNNTIQTHEQTTINDVKYLINKDSSNLTKEEFNSIKKLHSDPSLTIKQADKGGAIVLMDTQAYLHEGYRQLNDLNYYKKIEQPIFPQTAIKLKHILLSMHKEHFITSKQLKFFLGPIKPRPRRFYMLPKIHKDRESWPLHNIAPCRPIISDIDSETYRISQYLDSFLQPIANKHPSYLKNSYDFIDKIKDYPINQSTFLVTGDITALYTNMKHDRTLSTIQTTLNDFPQPHRPDKYIMQLLELILTTNDFNFNNETFLQTCGCPMGKVIGPSAANIYLIEFDFYAMTGFRSKPLLFFRYLDDIFFLWNHSLEELKLFEDYLNSLIPGISITLEINLTSTNFLDITIYKNCPAELTSLTTKVYVKPTATQNLLHMTSYHPTHTTKGIVKSQLIRYKRISNNFENYLTTSKNLFFNIRNNGYTWTKFWKQLVFIWFKYQDKPNNSVILVKHNNNNKNNNNNNKLISFKNMTLHKQKKQQQQQLINITTPKIQQIFPISLHHNSIGRELGKGFQDAIRRNPILKKHKIFVAYKNHDSISKKLISSKTKPNTLDSTSFFS